MRKICNDPYCLESGGADEDEEDSICEEGGGADEDEDDPICEEGSAKEMTVKLANPVGNFRKRNDNNDKLSCKILFISSLLKILIPRKHTVLVFSQSVIMLDLIQKSVKDLGYTYLRMDGKTNDTDRLKFIKVGGVGLTLTKADRVIIVDPFWNPSANKICGF
ncbi:protein CHROMATIN REMODELING 24-like [Silene latifolia]|uniref:protein CHROMATIN REMODELING 24-like n=1 Tax=Silene latifolia TaxID=37657 RepID=UPI003D78504D